MRLQTLWASAFALLPWVSASGFPAAPQDITIKQISRYPGVSITYKETHICETKARGWAGYVHLPSSVLSDIETSDPYNISLFFWYFEARHEPHDAPTAIYLSGGPGQSSMYGAAGDGGPCNVLSDSNSTTENPWSWNQDVNMLYVDSPVGSGYSYDVLLNSTQDMLFAGQPLTETGITPFEAYNGTTPAANATFLYGTFPTQDGNRTANSSAVAARTLWHFAQVWFTEFPEYHTCDKSISIWGNSYGGYWTSATGAYFERQNVRIKNGELQGSHILPVHTVGMTNGCLDMLYQGEYYPQIAYNNTYGLQMIPKEVYEETTLNFTKPGGCRDLIQQCRDLGGLYDPDQLSLNATVNGLCVEAEVYCATYVLGAFDALSNRSDFDFSHFKPDPFPAYYLIGYFNQHWVQQALGSPVNFTSDSIVVNNVFSFQTGDPVRYPGMKNIEYLLESGVKVAFQYGDRDYRCPWLGAEALSLQANWTGAEKFRTAGYEYVHTNETYEGGVVRQYGNLSFARVFESGHDVQVFQPETSFQIFNRAMFNKDIATGKLSTSDAFNNYITSGPASSFGIKNKLPAAPETSCYLYNVIPTCTEEQYTALANGTAEIVDFTIVKPVGTGAAIGGAFLQAST